MYGVHVSGCSETAGCHQPGDPLNVAKMFLTYQHAFDIIFVIWEESSFESITFHTTINVDRL